MGIRYLGVLPSKLPIDVHAGELDRWFTTHELLSRFSSWRDHARNHIDWLWSQQDIDGLWDFGPRSSASHYFPLSPNWRKRICRKMTGPLAFSCCYPAIKLNVISDFIPLTQRGTALQNHTQNCRLIA